jgi:DNA-binding CsgD family transcriptional regulator
VVWLVSLITKKLPQQTVNWYRKRILAKFGVNNTVNLVRLVLKEKLL